LSLAANDAWGGLTYTALERMIVDLHGAQADSVRARFRKLRLRPFPDDIRGGQGSRVPYDLPRIIALLAVFELNALYIPQGHAGYLVEATWPEWCRASIVAASELGLMARPHTMPRWSSSTITVLPVSAHATIPDPRLSSDAGPAVTVNMTRLVLAIFRVAKAPFSDAVAAAFEQLELSHGWTRKAFPSRQELADMTRGRGFLEDGPYVARATMLLDAELDEKGQATLAQRPRLQAMLDYLDDPVPVDAWKAVVGTDHGAPRLGHLLHSWAVSIGLTPRKPLPATVQLAASGNPAERARALIAAIG
jgi:hypothetical protein